MPDSPRVRPDAFTDLYAPASAVDPDPGFAADLRARLERALALPRGVVPVTSTLIDEPTTDTEASGPRPAALPYLAVADARAAIDWYADVFGAEPEYDPIVMPDGRIGHVELRIGDGLIYLADAHPELGITAPRTGESPVSLMLPVADADAVRERAVAAGASGEREPYDGHGQRNAWIVDPFGHRWGLHSPLHTPTAYRQGDLSFASLWVPDAERAGAFYGEVLGWRVDPDSTLVVGASPIVSVWGADDGRGLQTQFVVEDIDAALDRVRRAGGDVVRRHEGPYGPVVRCRDDQGAAFRLHQPTGDLGGRPPTNGRADGDLGYLTLQVVDVERAEAFYGAVLGWTFAPGDSDQGRQVLDTAPMIGLHGGHDEARAVPMWRVRDIATAVAAVRVAGGTATDADQRPYGLLSECIDDQGTPFFLGQM